MTNPRDDLLALAPCPFCGGAVKLETYSADYKRIEYCVMCHECDFCTAEGLTVEETVKRWNTRAASRPAPQTVDREAVARALCESGKFETGEGTCSLLCMDQLGSVRKKGCNHLTRVHGKLVDAILSLLRPAEPTSPDAVGEPVAWRYRWKVDGEWTSWRVADHSQKSEGYLSSLEETPLYAHPLAHPCTSAAVLQSHALKQALDTLAEIAAAHIPDCPAHYAGDELSWAQRHVGCLRQKAEIARDGIAAAIRQLPTPERGE